jgi:MFS family permease
LSNAAAPNDLAPPRHHRDGVVALLRGVYLSYVFRTINAVIASNLGAEFKLGPAELGFMTSVYFLTFGAVQLPAGVALDRYGPRRVQSALLLVAAVGSLLFATADSVADLMLGRALIGFGVAISLMAGLKAIVLWVPPERVALANGWMVMLGALWGRNGNDAGGDAGRASGVA